MMEIGTSSSGSFNTVYLVDVMVRDGSCCDGQRWQMLPAVQEFFKGSIIGLRNF